MPITLTKGSGSVVLKTRTSDNRSFATANYYRYSYTTRRAVESNHTLIKIFKPTRQDSNPRTKKEWFWRPSALTTCLLADKQNLLFDYLCIETKKSYLIADKFFIYGAFYHT